MLLVIPSITIKSGHCTGELVYPLNGKSAPHYDLPEERARLLRKENAKAIHLIFESDEEWNPRVLEIIEKVRQAVDIPIEISLSSIPKDIASLKSLINSGIYRLFLPQQAEDYFLTHCVSSLTCQKIVVMLPLESATDETLKQLQSDGIIRACITIPKDQSRLPIETLRTTAAIAGNLRMRLSLLFGVHSYKELMELTSLEPVFDSVILGEALEHNAFPCQGIWREDELRATTSGGAEANLWINPLASASVH